MCVAAVRMPCGFQVVGYVMTQWRRVLAIAAPGSSDCLKPASMLLPDFPVSPVP